MCKNCVFVFCFFNYFYRAVFNSFFPKYSLRKPLQIPLPQKTKRLNRTTMFRNLVLLLLAFLVSVNSFSQEINVHLQINFIVIEWTVSDSDVVDHYEVERLMPDGDFKTIGLVLPVVPSDIKVYSFKDKLTAGGEKIYYRIKTIKSNGEETVSAVSRINIEDVQKGMVKIKPNELSRKALVEIPVTNGSYIFRIYNNQGRLLFTDVSGADQPEFSVAKLSAGDYFMEAFHPQTGKRFYGKFSM